MGIECKKCGNTLLYRKEHVKGSINYYYDTSGEEADNSSMYDRLSYMHGKWWYCSECNARVIETEELDV